MKEIKQSGTNIDLGNRCSQIAYARAKKTFVNRPPGTGNPLMTVDGAFSNVMDFRGVKIGMSSDGIGTKIELAERTGVYSTLGFDLIAMVADDLAATGMETVNLSNILDVDFLDESIVDELMRGLQEAANFARITVTGGEIAELGQRIAGYGKQMHFNWGATGIGILPEGMEAIDGRAVAVNDVLITLKSRGFRSNGFSMIRRIMTDHFGPTWHEAAFDSGQTWGTVLLTPSLIYSPLITELRNKAIDLHGIAHITGGGIFDNLQRVLKVNRLGADLDRLFKPLEVMRALQKLGSVDEEQAYRLWNMGNGMLLILPEDQAGKTLKFIEKMHYQARICGYIVEEPRITLQTRGLSPRKITDSYQ